MTATWCTIMRERHVAAPRPRTWSALLAHGGEEEGADLSVEPPWRRVGQRDGVQLTVAIRDDGPESHLVWCAGSADVPVDDLAARGEALLAAVAAAAEAT
jgi:hypothetical protein